MQPHLFDDNPPVQPKEGDHAVCVYCGFPMEFDKNLKLKKPRKVTEEMKQAQKFIKFLNFLNINPAQRYSLFEPQKDHITH